MATTHPQDVSIKWVKNDMIKAMKQALEALEEIVKWYGVRDKNDVMMPPLNQNPEIKESMDAITSLRQAIEQAERQETNQVTLTQTNIGIGERGMEAYEAAKERGWVGLSDERLMEMPKQEPVATIDRIEQEIYENTREFVSLNVMEWLLNRLNTSSQQRKPLTDGSVFIAVSNYRRKTPSGKKDRTPHYDGISWIHSIVGVSRTKEGAENMAKAAEDAYRDTYPAYKTPGHDPMYVWEVEELAIEAAHGIKE